LLNGFTFFTEFFLFSPYLDFFELRQLAQTQFQNCLSLAFRNFEPLHECRFGFVFLTNDLDDFVNV